MAFNEKEDRKYDDEYDWQEREFHHLAEEIWRTMVNIGIWLVTICGAIGLYLLGKYITGQ